MNKIDKPGLDLYYLMCMQKEMKPLYTVLGSSENDSCIQLLS